MYVNGVNASGNEFLSGTKADLYSKEDEISIFDITTTTETVTNTELEFNTEIVTTTEVVTNTEVPGKTETITTTETVTNTETPGTTETITNTETLENETAKIFDDDGKVSQVLYDLDGNGTVDKTETATYNENGLVSEISVDSDNDGEIDYVQYFEYDENGNITKYNDGATEYTYTRDESGEITETLINYNNEREDRHIISGDGKHITDEYNDGVYDKIDNDTDYLETGIADAESALNPFIEQHSETVTAPRQTPTPADDCPVEDDVPPIDDKDDCRWELH